MKIATFNINNVNKRLANLLAWLRQARPDVACLQELKATDSEFPIAAIKKAGYDAVWRGEKSWNGVAILGRGGEPVVTRTGLPGDPADTQSRPLDLLDPPLISADFILLRRGSLRVWSEQATCFKLHASGCHSRAQPLPPRSGQGPTNPAPHARAPPR